MPADTHAPKLGLIAGAGALPGLLIDACKADRRLFFVLGLSGVADPQLPADAWIRLGEAGKGFKLLHGAGVRDLVMAGKVQRPRLADLKPDLRTAAFFARVAARALGDDGLLRAVIDEIEGEGFRVVGVDDVLASALAAEGVYGKHRPDAAALADIHIGFEAARAIGAQDIGQAAVAALGQVLGTEGDDGTDALIARCAGRSGVLVKAKKPQQDRRADLPAIGPETVRQAAAAGLRGIAVEAGGALVIDRAAMAVLADELGLFVVGVKA